MPSAQQTDKIPLKEVKTQNIPYKAKLKKIGFISSVGHMSKGGFV